MNAVNDHAVVHPPLERFSYQYMDAMRFVAAFVVVLGHARNLLFVDAPEVVGHFGILWKGFYFLTGFGHEAVMLFFVLSGFWIAKSVDRRKDDEQFWRPYLSDRLSRLLIVLVPALVLGGLLDAIGLHVLGTMHYQDGSPAISVNDGLADRLTPLVFIGNLVFLQEIAVPVFGSNGPLWSLACEFWFYVWFPAIVLTMRGRAQIALIALGLVLAAPSFGPKFLVWLLGAGLYYADKARMMRSGLTKATSGRVALLGVAVMLAGVLTLSRLQLLPEFAAEIVVGIVFAGLVWWLLVFEPRFPSVARVFARYGSRSSFSLYAVHFPLVMFMIGLAGLEHRLQPGAPAIAGLMILVAFSVISGWLFSLLTEVHTSKVRRRLNPQARKLTI